MLERYRSIIRNFRKLIADRNTAIRQHPWRFALTLSCIITVELVAYGGYQLYEAAQQRDAVYNYQPAESARFPLRVKDKPQPEPYQPNCKQPQSREDADLCAQWAAVSQVTESNRLNSISLRLSIGALIFTIIGTGLLVWTLDETRQTARRELRAYVSIELAGTEFRLGDGHAICNITLKNGGQTPAYRLYHSGNIFVRTDAEAEHDIMRRPHNEIGTAKPFTLHMNDPQNATIHAYDSITLEDLRKVVDGEHWFCVLHGLLHGHVRH